MRATLSTFLLLAACSGSASTPPAVPAASPSPGPTPPTASPPTPTPAPTPTPPTPAAPPPTVAARIVTATAQPGPPFLLQLDVETTASARVDGTTSCSSIFDNAELVLTGASGAELARQAVNHTCSPYAEGQPVTLAAGVVRTTLSFALDPAPSLDASSHAALSGHLAGREDVAIDAAAVAVALPTPPPAEPRLPGRTRGNLGNLNELRNSYGHAPEWDMERPHATPRVRVTMPSPTAQGALSASIVRRVLLTNRARFTYCYEQQLMTHPDAAGSVTVRFTVHPDGATADVTELHDAHMSEVGACVRHMVGILTYPPADADTHAEQAFTFGPPAP